MLEAKLREQAANVPPLPAFVPLRPTQVLDIKSRLLNTVSAALIKEPRFAGRDSIANRISDLVVRVAFFDPEFVLKIAAYVRDELNIRSTACMILALAASLPPCQPYMRKYFATAVRLPSDWLDVAATYMALPHRALSGHALPTCLRLAMVEKFRDFDVYQVSDCAVGVFDACDVSRCVQLGKYNKLRTIQRKARHRRELEAFYPVGGISTKCVCDVVDVLLQEMVFEPDAKPSLTLKQMIRQLYVA
jgi:hypothetical protein